MTGNAPHCRLASLPDSCRDAAKGTEVLYNELHTGVRLRSGLRRKISSASSIWRNGIPGT